MTVSEAGAQEFPIVSLIRGNSLEVFMVVNGQRRWIPDRQTFEALGLKWEWISQHSDAELMTIPRGADYPSLPGPLLKGSGPIVYLIQYGYKRVVPDPPTFESLGLAWENIHLVSDEVLQQIPDAPPIPPRKGSFPLSFRH